MAALYTRHTPSLTTGHGNRQQLSAGALLSETLTLEAVVMGPELSRLHTVGTQGRPCMQMSMPHTDLRV